MHLNFSFKIFKKTEFFKNKNVFKVQFQSRKITLVQFPKLNQFSFYQKEPFFYLLVLWFSFAFSLKPPIKDISIHFLKGSQTFKNITTFFRQLNMNIPTFEIVDKCRDTYIYEESKHQWAKLWIQQQEYLKIYIYKFYFKTSFNLFYL